MKSYAVVRMNFPYKRHLRIMLDALHPETRTPPSPRSRVRVEGIGGTLTLSFEASDSSTLRAAVNSYLRWVSLINDINSTLDSLSRARRRKIENT